MLAAVQAHARESYPRECCGILLGRRDGAKASARLLVRARNLAPPAVRDRYVMDPADRFAAEARATAAGLAVVGFYHSHPDHDAYFSRTDLESSEEFLLGEPWVAPSYAYLVLSVRGGEPGPFATFAVREGAAEPIDTCLES